MRGTKGGGLSRGCLSSFFANTNTLHLSAPRDSIKVNTFPLCLRHCEGWQDLEGLIGEQRGTFGCVWVGCSRKTNRSFFFLRGHLQAPVGDVLTELPTKLEVERRKKKK